MSEKQSTYEIQKQEAGHDIYQAGRDVTIVHNVIKIDTAEAAAGLAKIVNIKDMVLYLNEPSPIKPGSSDGIVRPDMLPDELASNQKNIDNILSLVNEKGNPQVKEVQAGNIHISLTELWLKKVSLLEWEAFQFPDTPQAAMNMKMALGICNNLLNMDPANIDVLLNIAYLLMYVTPDDKSDEIKVLHEIQKLLGTPKNDEELLQQAYVNLFLAVCDNENIDINSIANLRPVFERMGQLQIVQFIDQYLQLANSGALLNAPGFMPVGRWQVQISNGSIMFLGLNPDGSFQFVQQLMGLSWQGMGQWAFNPYSHMVQMQGLINGNLPYALGIVIQGQQDNVFNGTGTDGGLYYFVRV